MQGMLEAEHHEAEHDEAEHDEAGEEGATEWPYQPSYKSRERGEVTKRRENPARKA